MEAVPGADNAGASTANAGGNVSNVKSPILLRFLEKNDLVTATTANAERAYSSLQYRITYLLWLQDERHTMRIHDILDAHKKTFGNIAENSRESVRKLVLMPMIDKDLVEKNPDDPNRPTNSGLVCYRLSTRARQQISDLQHDQDKPTSSVESSAPQTPSRTAGFLEVQVSVAAGGSKLLRISPGGQNVYLKKFCDEFLRGPSVSSEPICLYLGDASNRYLYYDTGSCNKIGLTVTKEGKAPDAIFQFPEKFVVIVEVAVSSNPFDPARLKDIKEVLKGCTEPLAFLTVLPSISNKYLRSIAMGTFVWVPEHPHDLIRFGRCIVDFDAVLKEATKTDDDREVNEEDIKRFVIDDNDISDDD